MREYMVEQALAACCDRAKSGREQLAEIGRLRLDAAEIEALRDRLADLAERALHAELDHLADLDDPASTVLAELVASDVPVRVVETFELKISIGQLEYLAACYAEVTRFLPREQFGRSLGSVLGGVPEDVRSRVLCWLRLALDPDGNVPPTEDGSA